QGELLYNRIAPFYWSGSLESRLLDLANVKYVITTQTLASAKFTKDYSGEVNIYRNEDVLPRAFVVERARLMKDYGSDLKGLDPAREVLLEGLAEPIPTAATACAIAPNVVIQKYSPQEVVIEAHSACDGWLVLADAYFDGWQAFDQPSGQVERETPIFRADGLFRAVRLAAGAHLVRFKYNPLSFRVGLYVSFVAAMALLLMAGYWLWGRFYREARHDREAKRVLKNSALPMGTSLLNKVIDTIFAAFMLRLLGPENAGKFAFAVVMIGYADIFINFGLSTLVTREVSRDRSQTNRYLSNTALLRVALLIVMTPLLAAVLWLWRSWFALPDDTTWAIILLALGLIPSGVSSALSSVFYAHEQMEYPAAITVVTTLIKVTVSVIVLLAGFGFVGLAGANILVNVATMIILFVLFARRFFAPRVEFDAPFARGMVRTSYPLMLNDMLSRLFFRVDVTLLQPMRGDTVVGWYTTAYRYLDGINILPSTFTIALFPVFSRYAAGAPDALMRAYRKSLKYLIILAVPLMVLSFVYAEGIILLFGGPDYLPEAAIALRLLIGFMPLSFINNVTHYVLIAVNQQRYLTKAFVIGATFNVAANLLFIPLFSYRASAIITIFSELALLIPFYLGIRRHVGTVDWLALAWRPAAAGCVMGLLSAAFSAASPALLIPAALAVYSVTLLVLRALDDDDRDMLRLLIPARVTARWKGRADEPVP
ncbi:MAG: oligosaccharide flippase family protein, partial [Chloroflexi bacterium]|nr:oligosaccharide flippase family protein [Chloroflexota bacterium]